MLDRHEQLLRQACAEAVSRLRAGQRNVVERVLEQEPELAEPETTLELIFAEFIGREELGEQPDAAEYFRRFPSLTERIERLLRIHQAFPGDPAAPPRETVLRQDTDAGTLQGAAERSGLPRRAGDYEILEEIGRGGMGIVYKARHRALHRTVAYKQIRSDYIGREQRERFLREASAAARLQHPGIVQVFEVGESAEGPFLAMEWIAGGSLDAALSEGTFDTRAAAELVKSLADTMQFAHTQGVIHRDLKPANVLLTESRQAKVTDFGLAKLAESALPPDGQCADPQLTQSGAIVGTPAYMAPEQVDRRIAAVGFATDLYALGAILYELLTVRPPFGGDSPLETFQLVCDSEPIPPRRIRPRIDRDLETICLKCLQKQPGGRYPSAAHLRDDLARYLDGQPITARPLGAPARTWRWCRRRPLVAGLATALLLSLLGGLFAVAWQWRQAEFQRSVALANAHVAELRREEAEGQRNQAIRQRSRALAEKARAEQNYQAAKDVVDRFTRLGEELSRTAGAEETGRIVLEQSLVFFDHLLQLESADTATSLETAMAHYRAAQIQEELARPDDAQLAIRQAIALLKTLAGDFPDRPDYRYLLACAHFEQAMALRRVGQTQQAREALQATVALGETLVGDFPSDRRFKSLLATARIHWLVVTDHVLPDDRDQQLRQSISLLEEVLADDAQNAWVCRDLALGKECLAIARWQAGQLPAAAELLHSAVQLREQVGLEIGMPTVENDGSPSLPQRSQVDAEATERRRRIDAARVRSMRVILRRRDLVAPVSPQGDPSFYQARNQRLLGLIALEVGDLKAADAQFRAAVALADDLYDSAPTKREYGVLLASCRANLAGSLAQQSRADEAIREFSLAAEVLNRLRRDWSDVPQTELWRELFLVPDLPFAAEFHASASLTGYGPTMDDVRQLVGLSPGDVRLRSDLAVALKRLYFWLREIDQPSGMEFALREAAAQHAQLASAFPDEFDYQLALADATHRLAFQLCNWQRQSEAIEWAGKSIDVRQRIVANHPDRTDLSDSLKRQRSWFAHILDSLGRSAEALEVHRATLLQDPDGAMAHNGMAWFLLTCQDPNLRDAGAAVPLAERAVELAPDNGNYWNTLGAAYYRLGRYDDAVQALRKGIEARGHKPAVEDLVLLAMSEHGRGDYGSAKRHYDAAVAWSNWYEQRSPLSARQKTENGLLLQEARGLLGNELLASDEASATARDGRAVLRFDDSQLSTMTAVSSQQVLRQDMSSFGPCWSEDSQLWWVPQTTGARLTLLIDVQQSGQYMIVGQFTKARDYGRFQLAVNGQRVGDPFDGFNPGQHPHDVIHSGPVTLGSAALRSGTNRLVFEVVGKDPDSIGFLVGIDDLRLVPWVEP
jgi:tetratricopeptide (TPR) repeat protein/tRNA A-37 threonylcarbamoyl transferase component Bud32